MFTTVYTSLQKFTTVLQQCIIVLQMLAKRFFFTNVYQRLQNVYKSLQMLTQVYTSLNKFTNVCNSLQKMLQLVTTVYTCFTKFTNVCTSLHTFTQVYKCSETRSHNFLTKVPTVASRSILLKVFS